MDVDEILGNGPEPLRLPTPPLTNGTITLRPWRLKDAASLVTAWNDPAVAASTAVPEDRTQRAAERWIAGAARRHAHRLALDLAITIEGRGNADIVVGEVGLSGFNDKYHGAMIGYWTHKAWRRQGHSGAAVSLLAEWAMAPTGLDLAMIVARIDRDNAASEALIRGLGYSLARNDTDGNRLFVLRR